MEGKKGKQDLVEGQAVGPCNLKGGFNLPYSEIWN